MESGQPLVKTVGSESVRLVGGLWMLAEGRGDMPGGGPATWMMTLGYDVQKKKYLGTWIGSMMSHLWIYDGEMDASGRILTLSADGPGKMAKYQDVIEIKGDDCRTLTSRVLQEDRTWRHLMTAHYRRKK